MKIYKINQIKSNQINQFIRIAADNKLTLENYKQ